MSDIVKVYHAKTQEEYDYLMGELEKEGYIWRWSKKKPTEKNDCWDDARREIYIYLYDNSKIAWGGLPDVEKEWVPILPVTLPTQPTTDNVEKPSHYFGIYGLEVEKVLRNFIPRYENGYTAHRVGSAIEYLLRAPLKNGIEDIKKAHRNLGMLLEELGEDETEW